MFYLNDRHSLPLSSLATLQHQINCMIKSGLQQAQQEKYNSAKDFMEDILVNVHPELLEQINYIIAAIQALPQDACDQRLLPLAEKICNEMHMLYISEKEVLFPFITMLAKQNEKSRSCSLFKDSKVHYTGTLRFINELKTCLKEYSREAGDPLFISTIIETLQDLEQQHIFLQATKDKYLFAQFKSCSGCKTLS
jgi:iron-sulfur cluster repair protein YtfE (RIC family)